MDLGADTFVTFRHITLPLLRGAMFAGALLAFGLSFDEIVVTLFTAPDWRELSAFPTRRLLARVPRLSGRVSRRQCARAPGRAGRQGARAPV